MAQRSARRGRKNQVYSSCLEHAFMIWSSVCELPYGPRSFIAASEAGQMAASDYAPWLFKNRLHLAGRPQMSINLLSSLMYVMRLKRVFLAVIVREGDHGHGPRRKAADHVE
jgi:hypothetical protein